MSVDTASALHLARYLSVHVIHELAPGSERLGILFDRDTRNARRAVGGNGRPDQRASRSMRGADKDIRIAGASTWLPGNSRRHPP